MNKFSSAIKDLLPLFMLTTVIVLIFTQIPVKAIQILIILNFGISLCLFLTKFLNKTRLSFHFPKLVLYFCLFDCALIIATTRTFLAIPTLEGQIPLVLIIGQWICRENFICGFFTSLMLCASLLLYCKMHVNRTQEIAARFYLDKMSLEMFDIDQQIASKKITEEEGKGLKEKVRKQADHYSLIDGSAEFLLGTIAAFTAAYICVVAGGVAVGTLERNMYWKDALKQYIMLSSGHLVLFAAPLFIASLGFKTEIRRFGK